MWPHRVFVYGSLKRGFRHHAELRGRFQRVATTAPGAVLHRVADYPALVLRGGDGVGASGEVWAVDDGGLAHLDAFEGCPEEYQRASILLDDGSWAMAYVMQPEAVVGCPEVGPAWQEPPGTTRRRP